MNESAQTTSAVGTLSGSRIANLPMVVTQQVKKPGDLIASSNFTPEQVQRAEFIAAEVDFANSNTVLTFGTAPQQQINSFLDSLLDDLRVGEAGVAGQLTLELSEAYTASVASQGRGLDQVRALATATDKLIETLREGERIEQENKKKRGEAAGALLDVKNKVTQALQEVRPDLATR